ncbi:hypothetical protein O7608_16275 [Solwaraspora sp. WMMA2056]|uniref:hypothetical protein n=1 Tax=Solwaraspora sp. WMMA2056 TaxID=3015161 RepID=UPI00259BD942|nr:hypothetical protein [Solwaraspora sp. WMMA2056]WJK38081.1 hypothetical protein O7608_16275 [Solwaraspora sp. WMMA2056]
MIVASLLLILVAVTLLVLGLAGGSSMLLVGSIVASLLAAVALVVGARQAAAARAADADAADAELSTPGAGGWPVGYDEPYVADPPPARSGFPPAATPAGAARTVPDPAVTFPPASATVLDDTVPGTAVPDATATVPASRQPTGGSQTGASPGTGAVGDDPVEVEVDPPDEPAAEQTAEAERAVLARIEAEVIVVDGRPRYHLSDCVHLVTRPGEPLPVREALELGFTPCSLCGPDRALLTEAGRV